MSAIPRNHPPSVATRLGLVVLSVLSLAAATGLAISLQEPFRVLLASVGFAAYVVLFARALDGPAMRRFLS